MLAHTFILQLAYIYLDIYSIYPTHIPDESHLLGLWQPCPWLNCLLFSRGTPRWSGICVSECIRISNSVCIVSRGSWKNDNRLFRTLFVCLIFFFWLCCQNILLQHMQINCLTAGSFFTLCFCTLLLSTNFEAQPNGTAVFFEGMWHARSARISGCIIIIVNQ